MYWWKSSIWWFSSGYRQSCGHHYMYVSIKNKYNNKPFNSIVRSSKPWMVSKLPFIVYCKRMRSNRLCTNTSLPLSAFIKAMNKQNFGMRSIIEIWCVEHTPLGDISLYQPQHTYTQYTYDFMWQRHSYELRNRIHLILPNEKCIKNIQSLKGYFYGLGRFT